MSEKLTPTQQREQMFKTGFKSNPDLGAEYLGMQKQAYAAKLLIDVAAELILEGKDSLAHELLGDDVLAISMAALEAGEVGKYRKAGSKGGSQPKRKKWLEEYAELLLRRYPEKTKNEIWCCIPEDEEEENLPSFDMASIWRDDNKLFAYLKGGEPESTSKSNFFKRYLIRKGGQ